MSPHLWLFRIWQQAQVDTLSAAVAVLTSMITPALLISACGTFILSTSTRLGRVVDRVRALVDKFEDLVHSPTEVEFHDERRHAIVNQLTYLTRRARLLQSSLTTYYLASTLFVATSIAIGFVSVLNSSYTWVPVLLGLFGALVFFIGTVQLMVEARLAVHTVRSETDFILMLVRQHGLEK